MRIEIRGNVVLSPALARYVERRFQAALGRFSSRLPWITVRLTDENGPKGGIDKGCHVTLTMPPAVAMRVEESHADLYAAIDFAADRSARAVTRQIGRRRARRTEAAERRHAERTGWQRGPIPMTG
jgi:ribosomal subunit interface protein